MFYKNLAAVYHHVFPAQKKAAFVNANIAPSSQLLDVGCSDGRMAKYLVQKGHHVDAFDLSEDMVAIATSVSQNNALFSVRQRDMLDVATMYDLASYDAVICTGNTLVHLKDDTQIKTALIGFKKVLKPKGKLILQILNYEMVYRDNITKLPLIDNEYVRFDRHYRLNQQSVTFSTTLTIKASKDSYDSSTTLYPIKPNTLKHILVELGFNDLTFYSGFDGTTYSNDKLPLIVIANI